MKRIYLSALALLLPVLFLSGCTTVPTETPDCALNPSHELCIGARTHDSGFTKRDVSGVITVQLDDDIDDVDLQGADLSNVGALDVVTLGVSSFTDAPFVISDNASATTTISNTGVNSTITATGDLYLTPGASAQDIMLGSTAFNGRTNFVGNTISSMNWRDSSLTVRAQLTGNYTLDQMVLSSSAGVGNQLVMGTGANESYDFGHNAEADFALYLQDSSGVNSHVGKLQYVSSTERFTIDTGNGYITLDPNGANDGLQIANFTVTTADATPTTLLTYTTATNTLYALTTEVFGINTDDYSEAAQYTLKGTIKNDGGVLSIVGTPTVIYEAEDDIAWDVTLDTSGTSLLVKVTGDDNNIVWGGNSQINSIN